MSARDLGRAAARATPLDDAHGLAHNLAHNRTRDLDRERARDLACALDSTLDSDRALAFIRASALASALASGRDTVLTLASTLDAARDLALDLANRICTQQIDASGADLSEVRIEQLDALSGTIWTDQTIWPPDIEDQVRAASEKIRPGVYQVRGGNELDRSHLTWV